MPLASSNKSKENKIGTLKGQGCWILLLDYSNKRRWGMSYSLNWYKFEHTKLLIHFESYNNECAIVKDALNAYLLSQES